MTLSIAVPIRSDLWTGEVTDLLWQSARDAAAKTSAPNDLLVGDPVFVGTVPAADLLGAEWADYTALQFTWRP